MVPYLSQTHVSGEEDELPLGVEASINLDAFDPDDLDDEELREDADAVSFASVASSTFYSTVREVSPSSGSMSVLEYFDNVSFILK
jgi:hypothetical protein